MNSKKSYSSNSVLSVPLIVENLKRFWLGSVLAFIGYFIICCVPVLMDDWAEATGSALSTIRIPAIIWGSGIAIVAALLIYRYLQQQSSAAIVHAMPLSRKQLFHSNFLSGMILCLVPALLTGAILMIIRAARGPLEYVDFDMVKGFVKTDLFSYREILLFIAAILTVMIIVYAVAMLAAVLTGTSLTQAGMNVVLLGVFSAVVLILIGLGSLFLFGFTPPENLSSLALYLSPVTGLLADSSWKIIVIYLAVSAVLYLAAYCLYQRRKLERATDTLTFDFSKPIIKYLLTFCGMAGLGMLFYLLSTTEHQMPMLYLGCALGALITYVAVDMLIQKRFRIKGFVKGFGLFAIAAVVLFAGFHADILGYEKHVPEVGELAGVEKGIINYNYDGSWSDDSFIRDETTIREAVALHRDIVADREALKTVTETGYNSSVQLNYELKNGKQMRRVYEVPQEWLMENEHFRSMVESRAYKESLYPVMAWNDDKVAIDRIVLSPQGYSEGDFGKASAILSEDKEIKALTEAVRADLEQAKVEDLTDFGGTAPTLVNLEYQVKKPMKISKEMDQLYYERFGVHYNEDFEYYYISVTRGFTKTLELLKEMGLYESLVIVPEDVDRMEVGLYERTLDEEGNEVDYDEPPAPLKTMTLTDPEQFREVLDKAEGSCWANRYYEVQIYPVYGSASAEEGGILYLYFDEENVPDFIRNGMK
ncbi:MAG: hypothetical protein IJG57_00875 [Firmicutes bacterium]|nr:hypothetical protein [Bacillota bacterium]